MCVLDAALPVSGRPKRVAVSFSVAPRLMLLQLCLPLWKRARRREGELAVELPAPVATKSNSATFWLPLLSSLLAVEVVVCSFHVPEAAKAFKTSSGFCTVSIWMLISIAQVAKACGCKIY